MVIISGYLWLVVIGGIGSGRPKNPIREHGRFWGPEKDE